MDLLYGIRILAVNYFVLSGCTRLTDRRTDRMRMHSQLYGNKTITVVALYTT